MGLRVHHFEGIACDTIGLKNSKMSQMPNLPRSLTPVHNYSKFPLGLLPFNLNHRFDPHSLNRRQPFNFPSQSSTFLKGVLFEIFVWINPYHKLNNGSLQQLGNEPTGALEIRAGQEAISRTG